MTPPESKRTLPRGLRQWRTKPTVSVSVAPGCRRRGAAKWSDHGCKQCVVDENASPGKSVEQAGLAGVGYPTMATGDSWRRRSALGLLGDVHLTQGGAQLGNPAVDTAPIRLQLGLARTTTTDAHATARATADLPR